MIATRGSRGGVRPRPALLPRRDEERVLGPDEPQRHDVRRPVGVRGRDGRRGQAREHAARRARPPRSRPASGRPRDSEELRDLDQRVDAIAARAARRRAPGWRARPDPSTAATASVPRFAVEHVVPELERLPHQPPEHPQRTLGLRSGPGERRADQHRSLGGVRSRSSARGHGPGRARPRRRGTARPPSRPACGRSGPSPHRAGRARTRSCGGAARTARAPDRPTRTAADVPNASGSTPAGACFANRTWVASHAAALGVPVHQVVVHEGGRVQELERRADRDDRFVLTAARRPERPEAQRRPDPLPAGAEQAEQLVHQGDRRRVHPGQLRAAIAAGTARARGRPVRGRPRSPSTVAAGAVRSLRRHAGSMPTRYRLRRPSPAREACCYRSGEPRLER